MVSPLQTNVSYRLSDAAHLEAEQSQTEALINLLSRVKQEHQDEELSGDGKDDNGPAGALLLQAHDLQDKLELLHLEYLFQSFLKNATRGPAIYEKGRISSRAPNSDNLVFALCHATQTCTSLGLLLLQHSTVYPLLTPSTDSLKATGMGQKNQLDLFQWYNRLHSHTRCLAISLFRTYLKTYTKDLFVTEHCSHQVCDILIGERKQRSSFRKGGMQREADEVEQNQRMDWNHVASCIVELQFIHDAVTIRAKSHSISTVLSSFPDKDETIMQQDSNTHPQQYLSFSRHWRLDITDELCRPLVERLRFHFFEESTSLLFSVSAVSSDSVRAHTDNGQQQGEKDTVTLKYHLDRLPEWLFRYLREVLDNHGVYSHVFQQGMNTLIQSVIQRLLPDYPDTKNSDYDGKDPSHDPHISSSPLQLLHYLKRNFYAHCNTYFLREIVRMARHTLRLKSFFQHPDVVGSECHNREVVLRGIDQLFLFDAFVEEKLKVENNKYNYVDESSKVCREIVPPKLISIFLTTNHSLFRWWLEEEHDGALSTLRDCASSSLSSFFREDVENEQRDTLCSASAQLQLPPLFPPISELITALLYSAQKKSNALGDDRSSQLYVANVIAPLCSEYLDMVHSEAALLRKRLLSFRPLSYSTAGLSEKDITANISECICVVNGTHIAAYAVSQCVRMSGVSLAEKRAPVSSPFSSLSQPVLERVAISIEKLRDAMVDDFTSVFVETIVMERANLASYLMRCPFLLSQPQESSWRKEKASREDGSIDDAGHSSLEPQLSPQLNDSYHLLAITLRTCHENLSLVESTVSPNRGSSDEEWEIAVASSNLIPMLSFGAKAIEKSLSFAVTQKFLDIALDPQGMIPEIHIDGAKQFEHDVRVFANLFQLKETNVDSSHGPMERVLAASRLMALNIHSMRQLKESLFVLTDSYELDSTRSWYSKSDGTVRRDHNDESIIRRLELQDFYADERLLEEAQNMFSAKGFRSLALDEALSILNRRQ